mgnify:CR=1 FL=1
MSDNRRDLAILAGWRTPFCKAGGAMQGARAADLAAHVFREVLDRTGVDRSAIDEVILGCAGPDAGEANVARVAALRAGVPQEVPAVTVMRNCASGMEALLAAQQRLRAGDGELFLVGGAESMSNFPLLMGKELTRFFARLGKAKSAWAKAAAITSFRPRTLQPRVAIVEGLTDPTTGMMMGDTAEKVARQFGITRAAMDAWALQSHQRAAKAQQQDRFAREIAPLVAPPKFAATVRLGVPPVAVRANRSIAIAVQPAGRFTAVDSVKILLHLFSVLGQLVGRKQNALGVLSGPVEIGLQLRSHFL